MSNEKNLLKYLVLKREIQKIIDYIDGTIKARNATEPNALCIRNLLETALNKSK